MAIALTGFSGFCGFRPLEEIKSYLETVPEFKKVVGESVASSFVQKISSASSKDALTRNSVSIKDSPPSDISHLQSALRDLFSALMRADAESLVKPQVETLVARYQKEKAVKSSTDLKFGSSIEELVLRLNEQFPKDVGIFCSFLLNVVELQPGEACFLQANEPHAYLSGRKSGGH